jgi:hypothetical protein
MRKFLHALYSIRKFTSAFENRTPDILRYRLARYRLTRRQAAERGIFRFVNKQFRI